MYRDTPQIHWSSKRTAELLCMCSTYCPELPTLHYHEIMTLGGAVHLNCLASKSYKIPVDYYYFIVKIPKLLELHLKVQIFIFITSRMSSAFVCQSAGLCIKLVDGLPLTLVEGYSIGLERTLYILVGADPGILIFSFFLWQHLIYFPKNNPWILIKI